MPGSTNILQWNPTQANQESDSAYAADTLRSGGVGTAGVVPGATFNKAVYQVTTVAAALAQALAAKGFTVSDANVDDLAAVFANIKTSADFSSSITTVTCGSTVTFPAATAPQFDLTLTSNVSSSYLTGAIAGQLLLFIIAQDATGGRTFAWPSSVSNPGAVCSLGSSISVQMFVVRPSGAVVPVTSMLWITSTGIQVIRTVVNAINATGVVPVGYSELVEEVNTTSGNITRTLFSAVGQAGAKVHLAKIDSTQNTLTIATQSGEFINWSYSNFVITRQDDCLSLVSNGVGWRII